MPLRPELLFGAGHRPGADVDYRLTRNAVLEQYRLGRLSRNDVCDAHPELARAAKNVGSPTEQPCPVCAKANVVLLTYAFGPKMSAGGRVLTTAEELSRLKARAADFTCYVVEVCPECFWNHLAKTFMVGAGAKPQAKQTQTSQSETEPAEGPTDESADASP